MQKGLDEAAEFSQGRFSQSLSWCVRQWTWADVKAQHLLWGKHKMWWAKEFPRALNIENLNIICKQPWALLPRWSLHFPLICKSRKRPVFIHRGECSYAYLRWHFLLNLWKLPPLRSKAFRASGLSAALEAAEPIFIMGSEAAASFYFFSFIGHCW